MRKVGGAAAVGVHLHKLVPLLFHPNGAKWSHGHFRPVLSFSLLANLAICAFLGLYMEDFVVAGAQTVPMAMIGTLVVESVAICWYLVSQRKIVRGPAIAMPSGKTPRSIPSRIVARTVAIVSTLMVLVAGRDLFFPGTILQYFPRDDIYLEWTGAFLHSPPIGSPEASEQGLAAPLHIGDKFMSQMLALHVLLLCFYKFASSYLIPFGSDGSGEIKTRMIWKASSIGGFALVLLFRMFQPAANSASLDLRWHLMSMAYEAFILGEFPCQYLINLCGACLTAFPSGLMSFV